MFSIILPVTVQFIVCSDTESGNKLSIENIRLSYTMPITDGSRNTRLASVYDNAVILLITKVCEMRKRCAPNCRRPPLFPMLCDDTATTSGGGWINVSVYPVC